MRITIGRTLDPQNECAAAGLPTANEGKVVESGGEDCLELGGFKIHGARLESVETAKAQIVATLKSGTYSFPGVFERAQTKIPADCTAFISIEIGKGDSGALKIRNIELSLSDAIIIENPASCFLEKKSGFWAYARNSIANHLAKVHIRAIRIDESGNIEFDGSLLKGGFFDSPLSESVGDAIPPLNLDLRHLAATVNPNQNDRSFGLDFVKTLGQVVGNTKYSMDLDVTPTVLSIRNDSIDLETQNRGAKAHVQGQIELNEHLDLMLTADPNFSFLDSLLGHMIVGASLNIDHPLEKSAHVAFKSKGHLSQLPELDINGHLLSAKSATLSADGSADVYLNDSHLITNGEGHISCELSNPSLKVENTSFYLKGDLGAKLNLCDVEIDKAQKVASFRGTLAANLNEKHSPEDSIFNGRVAEINFRFHRSGRFSVSPKGASSPGLFALPFDDTYRTDLNDTLLDSAMVRANSAEFAYKIEKLTNSHIREGNRVELLVDGIASYPKRLQLIENAKESIWLQTLVFQDDESGTTMAKALADASRRGVKVCVIVDSQGSTEDLFSIMADNNAFKILRAAGVDLQIHNDSAVTGLRDVIDVIIDNQLTSISKHALLSGSISKLVSLIAHVVVQLQKGELELEPTQETKLLAGINKGLGRPLDTVVDSEHPLFSLNKHGAIQIPSLISRLQEIVKHIYSWHEKHFIVDGQLAILGGMNIADAYMFGGRLFRNREGKITEGWRDTDLLIEGPSVDDAAAAFSKNWLNLTGNKLVATPFSPTPERKLSGKDVRVQIIQHSPSIDGDNHITSFLIAHLNRLGAGETALFENAYFCVSSSLSSLSEAMIKAAKRGVKVVVLTNSEMTSDLPSINSAAFLTYRSLLKGGVRIFERKDKRTIHSKIAVLGAEVAIVGSANLDNRSARINSEVIAAVYDEDFANKQREVIENDLGSRVAREIMLADLASVSTVKSAHFAAMSLLKDFC